MWQHSFLQLYVFLLGLSSDEESELEIYYKTSVVSSVISRWHIRMEFTSTASIDVQYELIYLKARYVRLLGFVTTARINSL